MEPFTRRVRLIIGDEYSEYSEHLDGPRLPDWAETLLAEERRWHRFLRGTGAVSPAESAEALEAAVAAYRSKIP